MQSNGSTTLDRTNYYEVFQAGDANLKWAIGMEADRMVNSNIARKDLDSEMTVVRNEFESGENSPYGVMMKRMQSVAYDWHNYGKPTIGNRSDIENVGIDHLRAFYHLYYQPDNAVLLIAGKFEPARTLQWIADAFGPLPKPKRARPVFWTVEPTQDGERSFSVRRKGDVQIVEVGYHVPSSLHADSDALSFAAEILTDTPNGRLHKELVESGLATQVFSQDVSGYAPGLQIIGAVVKKGDAIEPVRDALLAAVETFYRQPPTKEEMERVRRNDTNQIEKMLNDPQEVGIALSDMIALGDWRLLFHERDAITTVTAQEVATAAEKYFKRDNRTVGMFLPEDNPQRAEIPAAPAVAEVMKDFKATQQVSHAEAFEPTQANIDARTQHHKIGGLQVALLPKKTRGETVAVAWQLHWGDEKSLFGKKGRLHAPGPVKCCCEATANSHVRSWPTKWKSSRCPVIFIISRLREPIFLRRCGWQRRYCRNRTFRKANSNSCGARCWSGLRRIEMIRRWWRNNRSAYTSIAIRQAIGAPTRAWMNGLPESNR